MEKNRDILFYIKTLDKQISEDFNMRLSKHGLTAQQGRILFYVIFRSDDEIHQTDIEKHFNLSKSTVSGLVKRLIKNQFLEKKDEGRYPILKPTSKGMKVRDDICNSRELTIQKLFKGLNETKQKELEESLKILIRNMEEENL